MDKQNNFPLYLRILSSHKRTPKIRSFLAWHLMMVVHCKNTEESSLQNLLFLELPSEVPKGKYECKIINSHSVVEGKKKKLSDQRTLLPPWFSSFSSYIDIHDFSFPLYFFLILYPLLLKWTGSTSYYGVYVFFKTYHDWLVGFFTRVHIIILVVFSFYMDGFIKIPKKPKHHLFFPATVGLCYSAWGIMLLWHSLRYWRV